MIFQPSVGESHQEHPEPAKATTTDGTVIVSTPTERRAVCASLARNGGSSYSEEPGVEIL